MYASGSEEKVIRILEAPQAFLDTLAYVQGRSPVPPSSLNQVSTLHPSGRKFVLDSRSSTSSSADDTFAMRLLACNIVLDRSTVDRPRMHATDGDRLLVQLWDNPLQSVLYTVR